MSKIIPDTQQDHRKAASSSATAEILASLSPEDRKLVQEVMDNNPGLSAEKALAMLNEAGM